MDDSGVGLLILDNKGVPTDFWNNESHDDKNPYQLPKGWKIDEAIYDDGTQYHHEYYPNNYCYYKNRITGVGR